MTNPINSLMVSDGPSVFYDSDFRIVLETHLTFLRTHVNTVRIPIDSNAAYRFEGDLYGLLHSFSISAQYHWIIMRVNDMTTPTDARLSLSSLLIPSNDTIERIRDLYMISHKIS